MDNKSQFNEPKEFSFNAAPGAINQVPQQQQFVPTPQFEPMQTPQAPAAPDPFASAWNNVDSVSVTEMPTYTQPKNNVKKVVFACVGAVAAIAVISVIAVNFVFGNSLAVTRSLHNFTGEVTERLDASPLGALLMLMEIGEHGMLEVDVQDSGMFGVSANFAVHSNQRAGESAVSANVGVFGMSFDAELYMNRERIALGSSLLDDYYGFRYDAFDAGIQSLGSRMGLDRQLTDILTRYISYMEEQLNDPLEYAKWVKPYTDMLIRHMKRTETAERGVEVRTGREEFVTVRRVAYTFNENDLVAILRDLLELVEKDKYLQDSFNLSDGMSSLMGIPRFDMFTEQIRDAIDEFESNLEELDLTLAFYIGNGNRLVQVGLYLSYEIVYERWDGTRRRDSDSGAIVLNFGADVNSTWTFSVYDNDSPENFMMFEWRFTGADSGNVRHEFVYDGQTVALFDWNTANDGFAVELGLGAGFELAGQYRINSDGFELSFGVDTVQVAVRGEKGGSVPNPTSESFVNVDVWDTTLFGELESLLELGSLFGLGGIF
jgi:hypothetical protein